MSSITNVVHELPRVPERLKKLGNVKKKNVKFGWRHSQSSFHKLNFDKRSKKKKKEKKSAKLDVNFF